MEEIIGAESRVLRHDKGVVSGTGAIGIGDRKG